MSYDINSAHLVSAEGGKQFSGKGYWILGHLRSIEKELRSIVSRTPQDLTLDMSSVSKMDSAGALLLEKFIRLTEKRNKKVTLVGLEERYSHLLDIIDSEIDQTYRLPKPHQFPNVFRVFGQWIVEKTHTMLGVISFIGEIIEACFICMMRPRLISWRAVLAVFHNNCYSALPIVALLNLLIGIVMAFQMGLELSSFGMDYLIVNLAGMIMLREFAPLMTAIIAAGRTSTSFTAQVGAMVVNEEVDALRTMGISPANLLVVPKLLGIIIAFPLLTVWADIFALIGYMFVAKVVMGISFYSFLDRMQDINPTRDFLIGLLKTPIFAIMIAIVGCYQGFSVERSSVSIGIKTTHSAVQSLFLIIIINSLFSIMFPWTGLS